MIKYLIAATLLSAPVNADILTVGFDGNWGQRSFGDRRGDLKTLSYTSDYLYLETGLSTPMYNGDWKDTGYISAYVGKQFKNLAVYGGVDLYNGAILDFGHEVVTRFHGFTNKSTRTSPASSGFVINPSIKVRYDKSFSVINTVVYGKASVKDNHVGAGLFFGGRPNLPGMPVQKTLYVGVAGRYMASDLITETKWQADFMAGVTVDVGKLIVGVDFRKPLLATMYNPQYSKPVEEIRINVGWNF